MSTMTRQANFERALQYKSSIKSLDEQIQALEQEREEKHREYFDVAAKHTAMCLLPDILVHIFKWTHLDAQNRGVICDISHMCLRNNESPMNISQVCRSWRHVALCLSDLWSSIHANPQTYREIENTRFRLGEWLQRCTNPSFTLNFGIVVLHPDEDEEEATHTSSLQSKMLMKSVLKVLLQTASRWKEAYLSFERVPAYEDYKIIDLPLLESLRWIEISSEDSRYLPRTVVDLSCMPNIRQLRISGDVIIPTIPLGIHLSKLTSLTLHTTLYPFPTTKAPRCPPLNTTRQFPSASDCFNVFRNSPLLKEVRVHFADGDEQEDGEENLDFIALNDLELLHLTCSSTRSINHVLKVLRRITAPRVEELGIRHTSTRSGSHLETTYVFVALRVLITRSSMSPSKLLVRWYNLGYELNDIFAFLPNLKALHLAFYIIPTSMIRTLLRVDEADEFQACPQLESVYLTDLRDSLSHSPRHRDVIMSEVVNFAQRRWDVREGRRRLREIHLQSPVLRRQDISEWPEFDALVSGGLDFKLEKLSAEDSSSTFHILEMQ